MHKYKNLLLILFIAIIIIVFLAVNADFWLFKDKANVTSLNQPDAVQSQIAQTLSVTLEVADKKYQTQVPAGSTVYDLMKILQLEQNLQFVVKEYSGLGAFVEEINGLKNDSTANKYWLYYINSQPAQVGISNYQLQANDLISWRYEKPNF